MNIGMKNKIYGRKVGSSAPMALLREGDGTSNSNSAKRADPGVLIEFVIANARRFILENAIVCGAEITRKLILAVPLVSTV